MRYHLLAIVYLSFACSTQDFSGKEGTAPRRYPSPNSHEAQLKKQNTVGQSTAEMTTKVGRDPSDDFTSRLAAKGAQSGEIQISLKWDNINDLDLHIMGPGGHIFYFNRQDQSGGFLDIDANANRTDNKTPVENVFWKKAIPGHYKIYVDFFRTWNGEKTTSFEVRKKIKDEVTHLDGEISLDLSIANMTQRAMILVDEFDYGI